MSHLPEGKELSRKRRGKRQQKASERSPDSRRQAGRRLCSYKGERNHTHTHTHTHTHPPQAQQESSEGVGRERNSV